MTNAEIIERAKVARERFEQFIDDFPTTLDPAMCSEAIEIIRQYAVLANAISQKAEEFSDLLFAVQVGDMMNKTRRG